jgi:hypothetical protein
MFKFQNLLLVLVTITALLLVGCCDNRAAVKTGQAAIGAVQTFYDPLVGKYLDDKTNQTVGLAVVSADTALLLAGAIQDGYCASQGEQEQLKLQTKTAEELAAAAGIK